MKLSNAAIDALLALQTDERCVINTLRNEGDDWRAELGYRNQLHPTRFTVPIMTFRKLRRLGYIQKEREGQVSGSLIHSVYVLTEDGIAAIRAAD